MTPFERLGGTSNVRAIVDDFVDKMVSDLMIGFMFSQVDVDRLKKMEFEFTAGFLGADQPYTGRPLRQAHARHRIMGGQFDRRRRILEETLVQHGVPQDIREIWLEHVDKLRPQITGQDPGQCD